MPAELGIYSKTCLLKAGEGLRGCTVSAHGKAFLATFRWKRCSLHIGKKMDGGEERVRGWRGFLCSSSGEDNSRSNHLMKSFLSSEELPEVAERGRDLPLCQRSIRRPQI